MIIPEYVVGHWWEQLLHNQSALRLRARLLFLPDVVVIDIPWHLASAGVHHPTKDPHLRADYEHQAAAAHQPTPSAGRSTSRPPTTPPS